MTTSSEAAARAAIDAMHAQDPERINGRPSELLYADRIESWLTRLVPDSTPALRLAGRAQHLERWVIPRSAYPMDRGGYHRWRRDVQKRQGERARAALVNTGCDADTTQRVATLVAKDAPKGDAHAQALEDAACLVFLGDELVDFASEHPDYTPERFAVILRKTWAKMSPAARALAGTLALPEPFAGLLRTTAGG